MIIGITGIFGSGKTTVAKIFSRYGYKVVNADKIGHGLLNKKIVKDKVVREFGKGTLVKGKVDRRKLKDIVFYNKNKLKKLNKVVHPFIIKEIESKISKKTVVDAALLIEARWYKSVDKIIVVKVNKKEAVKRVLKKGKYNRLEINNIMKSQLSQNKKLRYADYVIDNNEGAKEQVLKIVKELH